ncbi:MAG TPA: type II toxin-antitoxin system HicB family antitoxin [Beijerinckiaceae bacterium]
MTHDVAIVEEEGSKAVGVWFPDLPGCFSAGDTLDEVRSRDPDANKRGRLQTLKTPTGRRGNPAIMYAGPWRPAPRLAKRACSLTSPDDPPWEPRGDLACLRLAARGGRL